MVEGWFKSTRVHNNVKSEHLALKRKVSEVHQTYMFCGRLYNLTACFTAPYDWSSTCSDFIIIWSIFSLWLYLIYIYYRGVVRLGIEAGSWSLRIFTLVLFSCPQKVRNGNFERGCEGKSISNKASLSGWRVVQEHKGK